MSTKKLLRRYEASKYLEEKHCIIRAPKTLAKYAVSGGGPEYHLDGRFPLYPIEKLDEWAISRLSPLKRNTSDKGGINHDL